MHKVFQSAPRLWPVEHMKTTMPMWWRIARFIENRYVHRAHPHYLPELAVFAVIAMLGVWPVFLVATALERMK
jgi:hypothetical protein